MKQQSFNLPQLRNRVGLFLLLGVLLLILVSPVLAQGGGPYIVSGWTVNGTGGISQSDNGQYTLAGTITQSEDDMVMHDSSGTYTLSGSFWPGGSETDPVPNITSQHTYLPLILK
jgi:hypothetical protein